MKLILTENDLATIDNALRGLAGVCRNDAAKADESPAGKFLRVAATKSADEYEALANKLQDAEQIVVDLS